MLKSLAIAGIFVIALSAAASAAVSGPQGVGTMTETSDGGSPVAWMCGPVDASGGQDGEASYRVGPSGARLVLSVASTRGAAGYGSKSAHSGRAIA
jgi:hypothetical protein